MHVVEPAVGVAQATSLQVAVLPRTSLEPHAFGPRTSVHFVWAFLRSLSACKHLYGTELATCMGLPGVLPAPEHTVAATGSVVHHVP